MSERQVPVRDPLPAWAPGALFSLIAARLLVSASIYPWTGYLTNAGLAALFLVLLLREKRGASAPDRILPIGLALYFGAALVSAPFSLVPWSSLARFLMHLGDLFLFLGVARLQPRHLPALAGVVVGCASISAAFGLRQRLGGFSATLESGLAGEYAANVLERGRVFGLTFSPDLLAGMIAGALPLGLGLVTSYWPGKSPDPDVRFRSAPLVAALLLALLAAVLVLTRSVGGWLAASAGVLVWIGLAQKWSGKGLDRSRLVILALAVLIALAGTAVIVALRGGHFLVLDYHDNPAHRRLDNWITGLKVWLEFPLFGAGVGQHGLAALLHRSLEGNEAKHAHNCLIEVLAETGPLGLCGLILIFIAFSRRALGLPRLAPSPAPESEPDRKSSPWLTAGFAAAGTAVALHSLIDFDWQVSEVADVFWIALAALVIAEPGPILPLPEGKGRIASALLALLALTAIPLQLYQARAAKLRAQAVESARDGDWARARGEDDKALAWAPFSDELYALRAQAIINQTRGAPSSLPEVEASLEKAAAINPRFPFYQRDLGLLIFPRDPRLGLDRLERAVALYPNSLDLNLTLGRKLHELGRREQAEQVLLHATQCSRVNGRALTELGLLYRDQGRSDLAEDYLRQGAQARPLESARVIAFSRFLVEQGRNSEARQALESWLHDHPADPEATQELGKLPSPQSGP